MKMKPTYLLAALLCLSAIPQIDLAAQEYIPPKVVISKEKIRSGGKIYYSHVVQERQTIYSISKAYGVTMEEIYDANPVLKLETEGLKKDQILLIPYKGEIQTAEPEPEVVNVEKKSGNEKKTAVKTEPANQIVQGNEEYFIHKVKWYEDIDGIAKKYGVSKESIKNINKMTSDKLKRRQDLKIPRDPALWEGKTVAVEDVRDIPAEEPVKDAPVIEYPGTEKVSKEDEGSILDDLFLKEGKHDVNISLLIPFSSTKSGDRISFMDFYCGSLLAARSLGQDGVNLDINTYDVGNGNMPVSHNRLASSDFAIGPVSKADIVKAAGISEGDTWIVSPLDMRVEPLTDSIARIIQAPTSTAIQIKNMVKWIKSDSGRGDKVLIVTPSTPESEYRNLVEKEMGEYGVSYTVTTLGSMRSHLTSTGTNRIVLACDYTERNTVFLIEALRNLYMAQSGNSKIVLYSTSKIRTYDQIEVEQLHKVNLHASVTYFVDYGSREVKDFLLKYRALYNTEPSRSAYSGYDLTMYFSTLAHKYGKKWPRAFHKVDYKGLQSDFDLERTEAGSYINKAVRRVVYNTDYSVTLAE